MPLLPVLAAATLAGAPPVAQPAPTAVLKPCPPEATPTDTPDASAPSIARTAPLEDTLGLGWVTRVRKRLNAHWEVGVEDVRGELLWKKGTWTTTVAATVDADGAVVDLCLIAGSGVPALDDAVRAAFAAVGTLEQPPPALLRADGTFRLEASFVVANPLVGRP